MVAQPIKEIIIRGIMSIYAEREVHEKPTPELRGALQVFNWAVLEPEDGIFDWYWLDKNLTCKWRMPGSSKSNHIHTQGAEDKRCRYNPRMVIQTFARYPIHPHTANKTSICSTELPRPSIPENFFLQINLCICKSHE